MIGVDREGNVIVVELKRDRTPRDTIAHALEYASFVARLNADGLERILRRYENDESLSLVEHHREYFELGETEAVSFNKDQHIVVVGQDVTSQIRQTAAYLRSKGIKATCVEFTFFKSGEGNRILSQDIVVGKDTGKPAPVESGSLPRATEGSFLASCDEYGRVVFASILEMAKEKSMPIHWGAKGFSLNVDLNGVHAAICYGYPPNAVYKQSLYTALGDGPGGVKLKTAVPDQINRSLREQAVATDLFVPAGQELKCHISRELTNSEVGALLKWCESVEESIRKYGLKQ